MPFQRRRRSSKKTTAQAVRALARRIPRPRVRQVFVKDQQVVLATWTPGEFLNPIAQGDDDDQRTSDSIAMKSLEIKFDFTTAAAIDSAAIIRYIIILDKQTNGVVANTATIFNTDNSTVSSYDNVFVPRRYKILADQTFSMNEFAANASVVSKKTVRRKFHYKSGLKIRYKGTAAGVGNVMSGSVLLYFITDNVANQPSVNYETKIEYVDL